MSDTKMPEIIKHHLERAVEVPTKQSIDVSYRSILQAAKQDKIDLLDTVTQRSIYEFDFWGKDMQGLFIDLIDQLRKEISNE